MYKTEKNRTSLWCPVPSKNQMPFLFESFFPHNFSDREKQAFLCFGDFFVWEGDTINDAQESFLALQTGISLGGLRTYTEINTGQSCARSHSYILYYLSCPRSKHF